MTSTSGPGAPPSRTENLALIFQEVLTAIVRLRSNRQELTDAQTFRSSMREAIRTAIQEARNQAGYNADDIKMATLALVGFLDESVLNTRNPIFADWPRKPLQEELFGIHMAGELFFRNLEQLLGRPDSVDLADLLEVHYLCLLLGYAGRYSMGGSAELQAVTQTTGDRIRRIRGVTNDPFMEKVEDPPEVAKEAKDPWLKPLAITAVACFALMLILFATYKLALSSGAGDLRAAAAEVKN
ncbi:MAG: DotU family type IV/VI secretion system protein [Acidobacteria bacterium]|nr:DotU family type IV/VI secretion system protein [Acidobacteriota bacterium]